MTEYSVVDHGNENIHTFATKQVAHNKASGIKDMDGIDADAIEVVPGDYDDYADFEANHDSDDDTTPPKEDTRDAEIPPNKEHPIPEEPPEPDTGIDDLGESLQDDPLELLPSHMIDTIQGEPAINKRGYAMIAERFGVSVQSRIVVFPWDNEDNRAVARATAETEDGKEYTDYASASVDDGDMSDQIIELASTRALKRVTGWATGLGIVSYHELSEEL